MTLAELRYLVAVADLRHFGRAAERCHITQPTLSSQLKKLEETLGVPLVERTTRVTALTPLGALPLFLTKLQQSFPELRLVLREDLTDKRIVTHARRILEEADQISELARQRKGALTSVLRLGIIPTLGPYILLAALAAHELDVLLIALPDQAGADPSLPLFREPFCFVCPAEHRLGNQPVVTERDLARERLLLLDEGHCLRDQALAVCGNRFRNHEMPNYDFRATSLETICEMVAAGLGCSLLPVMAVPHLTAQDKRLETRPIRAARAHRRIGLIWRASFPRSEDLVLLGRFIQQHLPDSVKHIVTTGEKPSQDRGMRGLQEDRPKRSARLKGSDGVSVSNVC